MLLTTVGWGDTNLYGHIASCHAVPVFHALSFFPIFQAVSVISSSASYSDGFQPFVGLVMAVFRPTFPAVLPNPQNIFEGMVITNCSIALTVLTSLEVMWTVPRLLVSHSRLFKAWSRNPASVNYFKTMKAVVCCYEPT